MIFLNNTFITEQTYNGIGTKWDRGYTPSFDKLDIYKYSLSSLAKAYPWKKAFIFFTLDNHYKHRENELIEFIEKEWDGIDVRINTKRIEYVWEWQNLYDHLNDGLIWFFCNHDHVYMESSTNYLYNFIKAFTEIHDCYKDLASIYFSHWPELLHRQQWHPSSDNSYIGYKEIWHNDIHMIYLKDVLVDSLQVLTNAMYYDMWFREIDNSLFFPRSDYREPTKHFGECYQGRMKPDFNIFVPLKEICRHFDAYTHTTPATPLNYCPALTIPNGFFENNIKLSFYKKLDGYTYCDPLNPNYLAVTPDGAEYKFDHNHIPFFWKNKISDIQISDYDIESINTANKDVINKLSSASSHLFQRPINEELMKSIYKLYDIH